jgi:hypothetical protein
VLQAALFGKGVAAGAAGAASVASCVFQRNSADLVVPSSWDQE